MKVLSIDYEKYIYPDGVNTPAEFAAYLESNAGKFIPMRYYSVEHCVSPYYIAEDIKTKYRNVSTIEDFEEVEIIVLPREEYDERLKEVADLTCVNCVNILMTERMNAVTRFVTS